MKIGRVILLLFFTLPAVGQGVRVTTDDGLRFMTNEGHQNTILFLQVFQQGRRLLSGNEQELFTWDTRTARILARQFAAGKYDALTLSDDGRYAMTVEETAGDSLVLEMWNAADLTLIRKIGIDSLFGPSDYRQVLGIQFSARGQLAAFFTGQHVYLYDLVTGRLAKAKDLDIHPHSWENLYLAGDVLFVAGTDLIDNTNLTTVYRYAPRSNGRSNGRDSAPGNGVTTIDQGSPVLRQYFDSAANRLYLLRQDTLGIVDLRTGRHWAVGSGLKSFYASDRSSLWTNAATGQLMIATTSMVSAFDPVKGVMKAICPFSLSLGESVVNPLDPTTVYTAQSERLYLVNPATEKIIQDFNDTRVDDVTALFLTRDRQLICESRYTENIYNAIRLNDLSFRQLLSRAMPSGPGCLLPGEDKMARVMVYYGDAEGNSYGTPHYVLTTIDLHTDQEDTLALTGLIPPDSLNYPEVYPSPDSGSLIIRSNHSTTLYTINRRMKKLTDVQTIPVFASSVNNGFRRCPLYTGQPGQVVFAEREIILYDMRAKKKLTTIRTDPSCCETYFTTVLNHDSTKVVYAGYNHLFTYDLRTGVTDSLGYFRWLDRFRPISVGGVNYWLLAYTDGHLELRSEDFSEVRSQVKTHHGHIRDMLYDSVQGRIITTGGDGQLCFLSWPELRPVVRGWLLFNKRHATTNIFLLNDSNQYYLSAGLTQSIHLLANNEPYDYTSLDPWLNRPDVIARELKAGTRYTDQMTAAWKVRTQRLKIGNLPALSSLPKCYIPDKLQVPSLTDTDVITLTVGYQAARRPVTRVVIKDNNIPIVDTAVAGRPGTLTLPVDLVNGSNRLEVYAEDSAGLGSLHESVDVNYERKEYKRQRLWFIGIGMSGYADSTMNLRYAAKDVQDVAAEFKAHGGRGAIVLTIVDSQAFNQKVPVLRQVLAHTEPDDAVILYYAGHGIRTPKGFYLCLYNTDFKHPEETALPFTDLLAAFDGAKARKRLVFVDACQSGDFLPNGDFVQRDSKNKTVTVTTRGIPHPEMQSNSQESALLEFYNTYFSSFSSEKGVQVLAASSGDSYAMEEDSLRNGLFTSCFLKGLFGCEAYPGDSYSPAGKWYPKLSELRTYLAKTVGELSKGRQLPSTVAIDVTNEWNFNDWLSK
jgi:hypothetical protein